MALEVFGEALLEGAFDFLFEGLGELLARPAVDAKSEFIGRYFFCLALGASAGWVSLYLFPHHFIQSRKVRAANLALTPLLVAWAACQIEEWRNGSKGLSHGSNRFGSAYCFALAMALVRWLKCV